MTWCVFDLETTIKAGFKRKANPYLKNEDGTWANWIVLSGWATKEKPLPYGVRALEQHQDKHIDEFIENIKGRKLVVGQNIKFDITYMIRHPRAHAAWREFVVGGGLVWDLQIAEYMMQGQIRKWHMPTLDDLAREYGEDLKVDEVKLLWEAGVDTPDIDPDLLERYAIGEDLIHPDTGEVTGRKEGDVGVTRNIFLKQVAKASKLGMLKTITMNMGSLLATIEMELNGMYVDKGMGFGLARELKDELDAAKSILQQYLPPDLPFEFNWGNRYHLSPLIFGGKIKYERQQYDLKDGSSVWQPPGNHAIIGPECYAYAQKDEVQYVLVDGTTMSEDRWLDLGGDDTGPLARLVVKSGKNAGEFKTKKVKVDDYTKPKGRKAEDFIEFPGFTQPKASWESSTPGLYSVAEDVITELTENTTIPFLKTLGSVSKLSKDLGTYFISTDEKTGKSKGMLTLVGDDNIVHHGLNHTSTVTGRFSSSNPNLQNIPKGNKSRAKEMFVSRYPGGKIIQSDFSSLEVYVQANLTSCMGLVNELLKGTDMHCLRLSKKEGMTYDEVSKLCKGWTEQTAAGEVHHAKVEEWDYKRTGAKVFSFQLAYGAGAETISRATGMSVEDVQALIITENELFPEVAEYFDRRGEDIERAARPNGHFVMHPDNPAVLCQIMLAKIQMKTGKLYAYESSPAPKFLLKRGITTTFSPTERKNYEVQGEGGEIMKCAMWLTVREIYRNWDSFNGEVKLVNTVHDAQYIDSPDQYAIKASVLMHGCMEAATDFYCHHFGIKWHIAVPSDTVMGDSMAEEKDIPLANFRALGTQYREGSLRTRYMSGFVPPYKTL